MRLFAHAAYPFLEWRKRAYLISILALVVGLGAVIFNIATIGSWLRYGVDFTGGTVLQVAFEQPTTVEEIRAVNPEWEIKRFGTGDEFEIRTNSFDEAAGSDRTAAISAELKQKFGTRPFKIVRTEAVGPKVGGELQNRALIAILLSFAGTLIYLAIRFEWRYGVAALIATGHDLLITLGILALMRSEISLGTVAALLTIVGYSLNDTIVIFDRIREKVKMPRAGESYIQVLDRAINETLPRTILSSGTTLATLFSLILFGGTVVRDYSVVLFLGVAIGTLSSIFVASPALYTITNRWPQKPKSGGRGPAAVRAQSTV